MTKTKIEIGCQEHWSVSVSVSVRGSTKSTMVTLSFFNRFGSGMARQNRDAPLDTFLGVWMSFWILASACELYEPIWAWGPACKVNPLGQIQIR